MDPLALRLLNMVKDLFGPSGDELLELGCPTDPPLGFVTFLDVLQPAMVFARSLIIRSGSGLLISGCPQSSTRDDWSEADAILSSTCLLWKEERPSCPLCTNVYSPGHTTNLRTLEKQKAWTGVASCDHSKAR